MMNEKIKNFFACIGAFLSAALAVLVAVFVGKSRRNNADGAGMAELEKQHTELADNQRTERQIYSGIGELIERIEKRVAEQKNRDRSG